MNVHQEPAYSNGLVSLKKVGDLFTTTSDRARQRGSCARKWRRCSFVSLMCMDRVSWIRTTASDSNDKVLPWSFRPLTSANYASAYHDNVPAHLSLAVRKYWMEKIFPRCHTHPTARQRPLWLFSVHQTQIGAERDAIQWFRIAVPKLGGVEKVQGGAWHPNEINKKITKIISSNL